MSYIELCIGDSAFMAMIKFIQIIGQISRLRCASLEMTTKWIPAWLRRSASGLRRATPRRAPRRAHKPPISPNLPTIYNLFMQNKANFRNGQMNISSFITSKYEKLDIWWIGKNKANSKPNKANFRGKKMLLCFPSA